MEFDVQEPFLEALKDGDIYRYIVLYGGRGGGKSWEIAQILIIKSFRTNKVILCGREFQNSIKDSVHGLIKATIKRLNLDEYFTITDNEIRNNSTGSKFIFKGLKHNVESIKSMANIIALWIEEAETLSAESWRIIKPTIREENSQIYITFNPKDINGIIYQDFIVNNPPPKSYVRKINFDENIHFPDVLEDERAWQEKADYELYRHIWLGEPLIISDAQVFKGKFKVDHFDIDNSFVSPLHGLDFGFSQDPTTAIRLYIKDNRLYIYEEAYKVGLELDYTAEYIKNHIPDIDQYVVRADNARPESISYLKRHGIPRMTAVEKGKGSVEDGIAFMKSFDEIIIHPKCKKTAEEFSLYSYKVDKRTDDILTTLEDKHNHCIDAIRYALEPLMKKRNGFIGRSRKSVW
ncbi:PBSX family phage terminase large subunit [Francisella marina]|uniref:PBSX family phage terminase large subunit n=1 Tax=Francisella marina TaxID=2249302 RepID=UPI0011EF814E|nr:PBSX family phage terminase large subunit [Francisella marina]QEO58311.1 PBSX family phage terminase large subunit [Francisella marina]